MQRRAFLRSARALPLLGLPNLLAQSVASPSAPELHPVPAGEDRFGRPHPMGFSTMFFKVSARDTGGAALIIEHQHLDAGGPPLHLHISQEEWFYVMEGSVAFAVGDQRITLHPGESVLAPRRVPHTFAAVGPNPARMIIAFMPAGKMEPFFAIWPHMPEGITIQEFFHRYEMEYVGPSPFAKS